MRSLRVGILLGLRQLQRANIWTTILIVFVMMITFLNLIAISGVLVGLIAGAERAVRAESIGDIIISPKDGEDHILSTPLIKDLLPTIPEITHYSIRYRAGGVIEANYQERRSLTGERDTANVTVTGIDPLQEDAMSGLSNNVIVGEYLDPDEEGYILLGALYTEEYAANYGDFFDTISGATPGDKVRLTVGATTKEFIIKGIVQSKVDEVSFNSYIPEREFRRLFNRVDHNANRIVLRTTPDTTEDSVKTILINAGIDEYAKIQTYEEGKPKFIADIKSTMNLLGTFIGSIGLLVASITIFIIIFINALSRRQQIGILKGIGIDRRAIEIAYVLQASVYALLGSLLGAIIIFGFLIGYFERNPIQFPFSDGILVAEPMSTFIRFLILFGVTLVAGFIPAWMIAKQNTLNAILGRNK